MPEKTNIQLFVPDVGETKSIELVSWYVESGDMVQKGQELCELVTDKAAFPLEAPKSGQIIQILKHNGELVAIGDALVEFKINQET